MRKPTGIFSRIRCSTTTIKTQRRCLASQSSFKYAESRSSVLGKRQRDVQYADRSPKIGGRNEGRGSFARQRDDVAAGEEAARTGFKAERRRMSAEFAEMRRDEKQLFPSPTSNKQSTQAKYPTKPARASSTRPPSSTPSRKLPTPAPETTKSSPKSLPKPPTRPSAKEPSKSSNSLHIPIILETPDFVCINKQPSLLSQPGLPGEGTILTLLGYQRPDLTLQTVNRLDKNTSGVMVLGRTEKMIKALNLAFKQNQIEKNYIALVRPMPGSPLYAPRITSCRTLKITEDGAVGMLTKKTIHEVGKLTIYQPKSESPNTPDFSSATYPPTSGIIQTYSPTEKIESLTHFRLLTRLDSSEKLLLQFTPLTGRKHQLRLHSSFIVGAPLIGDHRYQYPQDDGTAYSMRKVDGVYRDGYALHCYRLAWEGKFDICATLPGGRWGDIWRDVQDVVEGVGFENQIKEGQKMAKEVFEEEEVEEFLKDPEGWARGIKGPLEKVEMPRAEKPGIRR